MRKISLLLVGTGGYGAIYLKELLFESRADRFQLVGAVDPYAEKGQFIDELRKRNVPVYSTLEEFCQVQTAELAVIATPIHLHARQAEYCMEHGSHVLCEKPICPTLEDAQRMMAVRDKTGRKLAIGFQWSFSEAILQLKQDIMAGIYGKINRIRTIVYFPRNLDYYHRGTGWAGKRRLENGEWLLDSVAFNATAHYLHNMLFLTGCREDRSAEPMKMEAEVYQANPIEMFDTCALRVYTRDDTELLFYATHAVPNEQERMPEFVIEGEKGTVILSYEKGKEVMKGQLTDGQTIAYQEPSADIMRKLYCMGEAIQENGRIPCVPETALPHLKCILGLADSFPETPRFPDDFISYSENQRQYTCIGLGNDLDRCWKKGQLPYEEKVPWARKPHEVTFGEEIG